MGGTEGTEMDGMQILCKMHANKHLGHQGLSQPWVREQVLRCDTTNITHKRKEQIH